MAHRPAGSWGRALLAATIVALVAGPAASPAQADPPDGAEAAASPSTAVVFAAEGEAVGEAAAVEAGAEPGSPVGGDQVVPVSADEAELEAVRADPRVLGVVPRGHSLSTSAAQSVPFVGAPSLWSSGTTGAGKVIVVIDTGVSPSFGGDVIGGACFVFDGSQGRCGPGRDQERAFSSLCESIGACFPESDDERDETAGTPCPAPERCAHGSAVAALAARSIAPLGVAPDASVYSIRVFGDDGSSADLVDLIIALGHVIDLVEAGLPVAAVNLSVASDQLFAAACDSSGAFGGAPPLVKGLIAHLLDRGVHTVAASGNDGREGRVAFPGCISTAVTVGATDLSDSVAAFSNISSRVDILAPGIRRTSPRSTLQIPNGTDYEAWVGTSFSTPHVSGAFALIGDLYPGATSRQLQGFLFGRGVTVAHGTARYPRLRVERPAQALVGGFGFPGPIAIGSSTRVGVGDFDGDGRDDVVTHGPGAAADHVSYGRPGSYTLTVTPRSVGGSYIPLVGNFTGTVDSPDDILWYAPGTATDVLWAGQRNRSFGPRSATVNGTYSPLVGDFDGDGWDDIFWFSPGPAADLVWYGGTVSFSPRRVTINGPTRAVVADVNGDGRDDIFFHGPGAASDQLWRGTASRGAFLKTTMSIAGTYTLLAGDMNGDGYGDVFLYRRGASALWRGGPSAGTPASGWGFSVLPAAVAGSYSPVVDDLNGDGFDDIVWYSPTGADSVWLGRQGGFSPRSVSIGSGHTLVTGNLDGTGGAELVMVSSASSRAPIWWSHLSG